MNTSWYCTVASAGAYTDTGKTLLVSLFPNACIPEANDYFPTRASSMTHSAQDTQQTNEPNNNNQIKLGLVRGTKIDDKLLYCTVRIPEDGIILWLSRPTKSCPARSIFIFIRNVEYNIWHSDARPELGTRIPKDHISSINTTNRLTTLISFLS